MLTELCTDTQTCIHLHVGRICIGGKRKGTIPEHGGAFTTQNGITWRPDEHRMKSVTLHVKERQSSRYTKRTRSMQM